MRWPWTRRKPSADTGGKRAREAAERSLAQTRSETEKYAELGRDLREIRARNHLALAFIEAARGREPRHD